MLVVDLVGKLWYGEHDWDRKKRGLSPIEYTPVEPYHAHPLDKRVWERQQKRIMRDMTDILDAPTKPRKTREASFWQQVKMHLPEHWSATRLENRVSLGLPDVLLQDDRGLWHLVELKTTETARVKLSPHQVAFACKHSHGSCWVAVKCTKPDLKGVYLYRGDSVMGLRMDGLTTRPDHYFPQPVDWKAFYEALAE